MSEVMVQAAKDVETLAPVHPQWESILTPEALAFLAALHRQFNPRREELLARREARKQRLDAGELPDFLPETRLVRDGQWTGAPIPAGLLHRRVGVTGPGERKVVNTALKHGGDCL